MLWRYLNTLLLGSAMENWGLILGSYEVLLVDMDYATTAQLTDVAEVTAHETVHQWFGDLVSPDWWSNLFLNEAFAQYWYANGINYTFPEQSDYAIDFNRFQTNAIALEIDCNSKNSRPVISDAPPLFSNIIYYKGSSLLNLLSNTLSPAVLQTGLQNYLQSYKYSNANAQDLWAALTQAARDAQMKDWNGSPLDVSSFMDPYTLEASYPILKLTFINGMVSYEQVSCIGNGLTWNIPVFSQTTTGEVFNWFVGANGNSNSWNHTVGSPYQIDNTRSSSYARVLYDDQSWANLLKQLTTNPNVFDPSTRASILDDGQFFVQNELWNVTRWLDLSLYLQNEYSLAPWKQALPVLKNYLSRFRYQPYFNEITNYVARVTENAYVAYGWRITTKWTNNALANDLTNIGCATGFTDCSDLATLYFEKFVTTCQYSNYGTAQCSNVSPDLRKTMYCYGNKLVPNDQLLLNLYGYYANNATYFDRDGDNLLHALGCTGDAVSLRKLITMVIFGQLPTRLLRYIGENNNDGLALYNFLISNTQQVALSNIDFKTFVRAMALNWSTDDQVQKMEHFMSTEEYQLLNVQQQKDWRDESTVVSGNNLWIETHGPVIRGWINQNIETTK
ncbi:unnamed protein product [Caenorhabditis auriculariae]|uniref:Peptidase M1 membrane alanine aminopeptidase domain-containing protein n=1 Tax=Caenorhabditis auriculariae TaxID=2777116 RepID=A0A8S1GX78_9PELO|nr:unnamed protein product [Caenorhabditis auriculariae]